MVNGLSDATRVVFDDERAVANAGVLLPALLAGGWGWRRWSTGLLISATGLEPRTRAARS
jgi:hypothetical protein